MGKQIRETWTPRWRFFHPPLWPIFRWAYKIDREVKTDDSDYYLVETKCIQQAGVVNKNKRMYSSNVIMKQYSRGDGASQIQIGIVNDYNEDEEDT